MARVRIDGDTLEVTIEGIDQLLSLHRRLRIPLDGVTGAHADPAAREQRAGLKAVGARIPGVVRAGTFHRDGAKVFWDVHRGDGAVVIDLRGQVWDRLVVEVADPRAAVGLLTDALAARRAGDGPAAGA